MEKEEKDNLLIVTSEHYQWILNVNCISAGTMIIFLLSLTPDFHRTFFSIFHQIINLKLECKPIILAAQDLEINLLIKRYTTKYRWLLRNDLSPCFLLLYLKELGTMITYFRGLANSLCPIVTKLVSWFDMNQAREETLHQNVMEWLAII